MSELRPLLLLLLPLALLNGCVSPSLNNTSEFEEYPLRPATDEEVKLIDHCLSAVLHAERAYYDKEKKYMLRPGKLGIDEACNGVQVKIRKNGKNGFLAQAQFHVKDSTVRWTMDENGRAEEAAEAGTDTDLDF